MSNPRHQAVEVLEMEYPLRLRTYALRRDSGGAGRWAGGDGVTREFEALASMELSVLAERRRHHPAGAAGGGQGAVGRTILTGTPVGRKVGMLLETIKQYKRVQVTIPSAAILAAGLFVGALVGAKLAGSLSDVVLRRAFGAFLLLVSARLILS